jgi:hypothetical protein
MYIYRPIGCTKAFLLNCVLCHVFVVVLVQCSRLHEAGNALFALVFLIVLCKQVVFEDAVDSPKPVSPSNLLPLVISSAVVRNAYLVNT